MPETRNQVRCHCGKSFKSPSAMGQHLRDSPNHPSKTNVPSTTLNGQTMCSCGRNFVSAHALQQHRRDSPLHEGEALMAQTGETSSAARESHVNEPNKLFVRSSDSTADQSRTSPDKEQNSDGRARKNQQAKYTYRSAYSPRPDIRSHGVWSSHDIWYSDVGDDHSLCDKDCGWCGHCADGYDF
ncbi:hypothetical protein TgHK011_006761 [Trichoderma gracile]|nr:hypothetical protein TgHK011_006761 [Trichoderma gracile]